MMCQRIGLPPISTIGFGRETVLLLESAADSPGEDRGPSSAPHAIDVAVRKRGPFVQGVPAHLSLHVQSGRLRSIGVFSACFEGLR